MKFELNRLARDCSNEEIIAEIQRVDSLINKKYLSYDDFNQVSKINGVTVSKRFCSWHKALVASGLEHKSAKGTEFKMTRSPTATNEHFIEEIQKIGHQLGKKSVTQDEFRQHSKMSLAVADRLFGSWTSFMKAADLKCHRFSNEEYFENLLKVWTHHGRQPFHREIEQYPGTISKGAYSYRFGSWRKALEAFVARMNNDEAEPLEDLSHEKMIENQTQTMVFKKEASEKQAIKPEDRREINLSLRYKVLSRDNFKCVRCGRSPATCIGIVLHVDHKDPFSKTGKTTLENLETKCSDCNLGKGNRHIE